MPLVSVRSAECTVTPPRLDTGCLEGEQPDALRGRAGIVVARPDRELDCSFLFGRIVPRNFSNEWASERLVSTDTEPQVAPGGRLFKGQPKRYQVGWPGGFSREYGELQHLEYGWDGGDEIPPSEAICSEVLSIVNDVSLYCSLLGRDRIFPELSPGFRGEVGLQYFKDNKELCIEVSPVPEEPTIIIIAVEKDDHGSIVKMTPYPHVQLLRAVKWFVEDEGV